MPPVSVVIHTHEIELSQRHPVFVTAARKNSRGHVQYRRRRQGVLPIAAALQALLNGQLAALREANKKRAPQRSFPTDCR